MTQISPPNGKLTDAASALRPCLHDGMCIGLGGFGLDRKPMTLVREIADAPVKGLVLETFAGGLDVELLLATAGKVARISACHVGLDHFGLAPLFREARQSGAVFFEEWSEFTQLAAWRAAAEQAPYAVVPLDPETGLLKVNPHIRPAPPLWGEGAFAVRAPKFDLAVLHVEAAHPDGWSIAIGDPYLDTILARAAARVVVSAERIMDDSELEARYRDVHLLAATVDAVVLAPGAALPGSCLPDYMLDLPAMRAYVEAGAGATPAQLAQLIRDAIPAEGATA